MVIEFLEVNKKIKGSYISKCPKCKKYIINIKEDTVTCPNCRKKYIIQYPEQN